MTDEQGIKLTVDNYPPGVEGVVFRHIALGLQGPLVILELSADGDNDEDVDVKITLSGMGSNEELPEVFQELSELFALAAKNAGTAK